MTQNELRAEIAKLCGGDTVGTTGGTTSKTVRVWKEGEPFALRTFVGLRGSDKQALEEVFVHLCRERQS